MISTQIATVCAWCAREQGQVARDGQSHGICTKNRNKEREKLQISRNRIVHDRALPAIEPVYGTCGHLAKSSQYSCGSPNCSQYSW